MDVSESLKRDRFAIRKDVMILRQVIYKIWCERQNVKQDCTLTEEAKAWIDSQVAFFFSEVPKEVLEAYLNEFGYSGPGSVPSKPKDTDLEAPGGIL